MDCTATRTMSAVNQIEVYPFYQYLEAMRVIQECGIVPQA